MLFYDYEKNFLGITEPEFCKYEKSKFVIQSAPYEHTSSYVAGSFKGPAAILEASHFVEFYDEMLGLETYKQGGIATAVPMEFDGKVDADAINLIEEATDKFLKDGKFVISLGAEHTVTLGFVKAHQKHYKNLSVLQLDAHADLRFSYQDNLFSHASVMARVHELEIPLTQVGIRALSTPEAELSAASNNITTIYAHQVRRNANWMDTAINSLTENVYLTIDADGFDPSIMPAVGTAEPGGLLWDETMDFIQRVAEKKNIVGFDIVECAPIEGTVLSEYTLAKLLYRIIGFILQKGK
ncbi:agmatinase [soil metagenome]